MTARPRGLRSLNRAWAVLCFVFPAFIPSWTAQAGTGSGIQTLSYDVWAGGIHAVEAKLVMDFEKPGRYDVVLSAKTRGFLGRLAPWEGSFTSRGWVTGGTYHPELHKSEATWRDEKEIKEYKYTKTGGFKELIITDHDKPPYKKDIESELTKDTTDAITAAMLVLRDIADGKACEGTSEVFDGKRRFKQIFRHEGIETLEPTRYNIFKGEAIYCTVEVVPMAGEWHEKPRGWMSIQEQGRERGTMPTVWAATLKDGGPAVPIKIRVKTSYGTLFMHLTEYDDGERVITAEKRGD